MSFETFITCDEQDCNARREVRQPGDLPEGWLFIQYIKPNIIIPGNGTSRRQQGTVLGQQNQNQQVLKLFCSWRCLMKEVKKNLTEKIDA